MARKPQCREQQTADHHCVFKLQRIITGHIKATLLLAIVASSIFGDVLCSNNVYFGNIEILLVQLHIQWKLFACIIAWCGFCVFLTLGRNDLPLIGLLIVAIAAYCIGYTATYPTTNAMAFLFAVTLGTGARVFLRSRAMTRDVIFIIAGMFSFLSFSSWWHVNMFGDYHGPRWMGLWDNPNIYGILMGAGVVLAIGLLADNSKFKIKSSKFAWFLCISAGMMAVGLVMSYSRGAWMATTIALLYLAWCYGRLKWRFVLPAVLVTVAVIALFWHSTADTAPWYLKRLDLSRPSAQHRVSAWRGAVQMMWDHPLGVGWNQAVSLYGKQYSPPEGGAAALTTNSYLMLGTELGLPGLLCFVAYVGLCLRGKCRIDNEAGRIQAACRAGAIVFVVAFWFDGGLFDLPTAALFWVLLELGGPRPPRAWLDAPSRPARCARNPQEHLELFSASDFPRRRGKLRPARARSLSTSVFG